MNVIRAAAWPLCGRFCASQGMRPRAIRVLAVLFLILIGGPAAAEPIVSDDLPRIAQSLSHAHRARVLYRGRTITLEHPFADSIGLGYDDASDHGSGRPALIVSGPWDTIPPLPRPIPWASIERLEAGTRTRSTTMTIGIMLGSVVGGIGAAYMGLEGVTYSTPQRVGFALGCAAVGGILGSLIQTTRWHRVHPHPATGKKP